MKTQNTPKRAAALLEEITNPAADWTIHPNGYTGSGRFASKGGDHAGYIAEFFESRGLEKGKHFEHSNDAPRGGWAGEFVKILPAGRRLKMIKELRAARFKIVSGWHKGLLDAHTVKPRTIVTAPNPHA